MLDLFKFTLILPFIFALEKTITLTDAEFYGSEPLDCLEIGGICTAYRPFTITQDMSVRGNWLKNEPYACAAKR